MFLLLICVMVIAKIAMDYDKDNKAIVIVKAHNPTP